MMPIVSTDGSENSQRLDQHAHAAEYHQQALALFAAIGDPGGQAEALNGIRGSLAGHRPARAGRRLS